MQAGDASLTINFTWLYILKVVSESFYYYYYFSRQIKDCKVLSLTGTWHLEQSHTHTEKGTLTDTYTHILTHPHRQAQTDSDRSHVRQILDLTSVLILEWNF